MSMTTTTTTSLLSVQVRDKIDLTEKQKQIFERLLQVLCHFSLCTKLRVAAGWVRDKLLGKECYDIDIAIDNMMGRELCEKVNEYLSSTGEEAQGIGVIQCLNTWKQQGCNYLTYGLTLLTYDLKTTVPVVNYIFHNSLKLKASDAETVINLHSATKKFISLIPFITSNNKDLQIAEVYGGRGILDVPVASKLRVLAGLLLREIKDFWCVALLASMLLYPANIDVTTDSSAEQFKLEKRTESFKMAEKAITDLGLEKVWQMKPLVNGKDIMNVLQLKTGGRLVREWQQKLLEWQLAHPSGTSEECLDWMRHTHSKRARVVVTCQRGCSRSLDPRAHVSEFSNCSWGDVVESQAPAASSSSCLQPHAN